MKKEYIVILLIFIFFGYSAYSNYSSENCIQSIEDRLTNQTINKITDQLAKHYPIKISGVGGSLDKGKVKEITVMYRHYGQPFDVAQARVIMVNIIYAYLNEINQNEEIRPYLKEYPFKINGLFLALISFSEDRMSYYHPYLNTINNINNIIDYSSRNSANQLKSTPVKKETYEEALKIVKDNGQLLDLNSEK